MTKSLGFRWFGPVALLTFALTTHLDGQGPGVIGDSARHPERPKLSSSDVDDIATLLRLEDIRLLDEAELSRILKSAHPEVRRRAVVSIGRIVKPNSSALLAGVRTDSDPEVRASVAFAYGQLKDAASVGWLDSVLSKPEAPPISREAAQALGKIRTPEAREALARYLSNAKPTPYTEPVIGEALLSMGRFPPGGDLSPMTRWMSATSVEVRWRLAWALFRPRDPKAVPHLLKLADDRSPEVRFWAVRGLAPTLVDQAGLDRKTVTARLLAGTKDKDRRVRTESLRALLQYDDDNAFSALLTGLASSDTWISTSAAENAARFASRASELGPRLVAASASSKSIWFQQVALTPLVTMSPETAVDVATSLARSGVAVARTSGVQALGRLGDAGAKRLGELRSDPSLAALLPAGGGRGAGGGGGGGGTRPTPTPRPQAEYRALVEKWIVPAYNGEKNPQAIWDTARGRIELELNPGDAPLGVEYFLKAVTSGDIVGTEFGRVVPNFVAQQQGIRNAPTLRDEVNRHGLNRGTLAWASSGLDTGRPGYTLGNTPQPHNEGDFTALGRVVKGMDVVDRLQYGDKILAARMK